MPLGLAHSEFLSWRQSDIDKAIAWQLLKAETCPQCNTIDSEWRDQDGKLKNNLPYIVETTRCAGCHEIELTRDEMNSSETKPDMRAVYFGFRKYNSKDSLSGRANLSH